MSCMAVDAMAGGRTRGKGLGRAGDASAPAVIPAKAGTHRRRLEMGPRFRGDDGKK
jgi:hypothetical protein